MGGPSGNGTAVFFDNTTSSNCDIVLLGANPTISSLTANSALGAAVRFGNSTNSALGGALTLQAESSPILSVTGNSSFRLAIFAELMGTQGFTKTGAGVLNFNTNTLDMNNLSGNVIIQEGTVWINQAGNLGTGNLTFSGNSSLQMRGNFTTSFAESRAITIQSGVTATFSNLNASAGMVFNGPLAGSGTLAFSTGNFTLNGTSSLTGSTLIQSGTVTLGANGLLSFGNLTMSAGTLNLGNKTQSVSSFSTTVGGSGDLAITAGNFVIDGTSNTTIGGRANGGNITFSGLNFFTFNGATSNFTFQSGSLSSTNANALVFSTNGTNTIVANQTLFGSSATANGTNSLNIALGKTNNIFSETFAVGYSSSNDTASTATVLFQALATDATLKLRGVNGTSALTNWTIGQTQGATKSGSGIVNLEGGTLDAVVTNLTIGKHSTAAAVVDTSALTISSGSLTAESLILGEKIGEGAMLLNSTLTQTGGDVHARSLMLGKGGNSTSAQFIANYNLTGGTLYAETISAGSGVFNNSTSTRNLNIGSGTLRHEAGANLLITGADATAGGRVNLTITGAAIFDIDEGRNITLGSNTLLAGSGNFSKNGMGDLILSSNLTQTYSGTASVNAGRLLVNSNNMTAATIHINGGTLLGNTTVGGIRVSSDTIFDIGVGQRITANTTFSGSGLFSKNGSGELAVGSGLALAYNGTATINAGRFTANGSMVGASINMNGGTLAGNSTFGAVAVNQDSTFDVSSNQSLTANSTFSGSANFSKTGNGLLTINLGSAYVGTGTVSAGNLTIRSSMTGATFNLAGGALGGNGTIGSVNVTGNSTFNVSTLDRLVLGTGTTLSGSANLIKSGNGTLVINSSGNQSFTGTTALNAGNFIVNSNMTSAGTTTVNATGATLSGTGTLGNVTLLRGMLAPGDGDLGILSMKTFTWNSSASLSFDLSSNSSLSDKIVMSGNFTKSGSSNFTFSFLGGKSETTYSLASWSGSTTFVAANFSSSGQLGTFAISSNELLFTTVPEPSTVALIFVAGVALLYCIRKRKALISPNPEIEIQQEKITSWSRFGPF